MDPFEKLTRLYSRIREENEEPQEQPPASGFAVSVAFAGLELPMPTILEKLYSWHNGIYHLNAFLHFPSLREAAKTYRSNTESRLSGWLPELNPSWFPVLDLNGDLQYCVDVENGEFWIVDIEDRSTRRLADNYEAYLDAVIAAFDRELAVYSSEAGAFEVESEEWAAICKEFGLREPW